MCGGEDVEGQHGDPFETKSERHAFIRKVFLIIAVQLTITFGFVLALINVREWRRFVYRYHWMYYLAFGVFIVVYCMIMCCEEMRRNFPCNVILLMLITAAETFMLAILCVFFKEEIILIALGSTAGLCFLLTLFAFQTSCDFTVCGVGLCIAGLLIMIFGLVCMFFPSYTMLMIFNCLGLILFSFYLIYDVQMIVGGHRVALSTDEYVFAAVTLYIDIIMIFQYILMIMELNE